VNFLGLMADARLQWPYVAKRGGDSRISTGGGERGEATRGSGHRAAGARGRLTAEGTRTRQVKQRSSGTRGGRQGTQL
jgi:hypothetical protein